MMCYRTGLKDEYFDETLPVWLPKFETWFKNNTYVAGEALTFVDFNIFELLDHFVEVWPNVFDNYPNIKAYHDRVMNLPKIKSYRESKRFFKQPLNNYVAKVGGLE